MAPSGLNYQEVTFNYCTKNSIINFLGSEVTNGSQISREILRGFKYTRKSKRMLNILELRLESKKEEPVCVKNFWRLGLSRLKIWNSHRNGNVTNVNVKRANSVLVRFAPRYVVTGTDDLLNVAIGGNVKSVPVIAEHRHLCSDYLLVNLKGIHRREVWAQHNQRSQRQCIWVRKSDTRLNTVAIQRKRKEHG